MNINLPFLKTEVQKVGAAVRELVDQRERLLRRREDLLSQPLAKSDVIELLDSWVDECSRDAHSALARAVENVAAAQGKINGPDGRLMLDLLSATDHVGVRGTSAHMQKALFFFFGDEFKRGIRRVVEKSDIKPGASMKEREREIERIDAEIPAIEEKISTFLRDAQEAGLALDPAFANFRGKKNK